MTTKMKAAMRAKWTVEVWLGITVSVLLTLANGCASTRPRERPAGTYLKVLSYNVNWGAPRPELAIELIRKSEADIVCLQETTREWEQIFRQALRSEYPFMQF